MSSPTNVTYTWTVQVLHGGAILRQRTYRGRVLGPAGYSAEDARRDVYAWLFGQGVRGSYCNFTATSAQL
ncbi:hypothetical protein OG427_17970 [Streptomyces sp. NBC_00133]|uniref:hypothetical protein n=1 Tax=Streptomyces sp. NBC_00133 TaxID=2903624 RepID=UPI003243CA20